MPTDYQDDAAYRPLDTLVNTVKEGEEQPPAFVAPVMASAKEQFKDNVQQSIGNAIGGGVIASDIGPVSDMTALKSELNNETPQAPSTATPNEKSGPSRSPPETPTVEKVANSNGAATATLVEKSNVATPTAADPTKPAERSEFEKWVARTIGEWPTETRIGWLQAFRRTDGPQNEFRDKSIWMEEFASSALFGSFFHNAGAIILFSLVSFLVGRFGGGLVSVIVVVAFGATYYKNSIRRFRRNARDDLTRELIKGALENDAESTEWINNFMAKFWLIYEPVLSATVVSVVDGILVDQTPAFLDSIRLTQFTLGTKAPRVESVKTYPNTEPDTVMMDWRVAFTPTDIEDMTPRQLRTQVNPKICLTIRVGKGIIGAGMPILVEDCSFKGHMRFKIKLMANFPHLKTVDFCFLEPPTIDYVLKPVGGETFGMDIAHIPGLSSFIADQTHAILGPMMYAPNVYTLDIEQMMTGGAIMNQSIGVVQFTIYNAKDLKNTELVGNSDPYVKIRLGNRPELAQTQVKEDTQNPIWNETNTIMVSSLNEVISMEIMDKENIGKDKQLGQANFDLKLLETEPVQDDLWCKILRNGKERGGIRIGVAFFPVQVPKVSEDGKESVPVQSNCGILHLNLAQAKDIARSGKTKSILRVLLNGGLVQATKKFHGANPAYGADIEMFITNLTQANVSIELVSSDGDRLGTFKSSASKILADTAAGTDWFRLEGGDGTGKLKMTSTWKPVLMGDAPTSQKPAFGVCRIKLMAGRNLRNVEIGGESDPYVVITGDRGIARGRTKIIDDNLNPVWNEIHYVAVNSVKQVFTLEVFDYQKVTKDRTLGKTTINMGDICDELPEKGGYRARPAVDKWAPLAQKDGGPKGELHYELSFYPTLEVAEEATELETKAAEHAIKVGSEAVPAAAPVENKLEAQQTAAQVAVAAGSLPPNTIHADDVFNYDSGLLVINIVNSTIERTGTYCEVFIDADDPQYKTQVQKSRKPKWDEVAEVFVKELEYAKIAVVVKERTTLDKDPIVGAYTSSVRNFMEAVGKTGGDFPVLDKLDLKGTIHLSAHFKPVEIELEAQERLDNMGNLTCTLVRARNLLAADRGGSSDPYIVFKLNGKEAFKSSVIKKTLNPEYNEAFTLPISSRVADQLSFEIFDWNQIATAKSLGVGQIDLAAIQPVLPNDILVPVHNKERMGEVQFRLKFMPEFLSTRRKSGMSFLVNAPGAIVSGAGHAMVGGVGAVAGGVGTVAGGAMDVTGAVGKGAVKGVGAIGKGVFGGLSAGASAIGLKKKKSDNSMGSDSALHSPMTVSQSPVAVGLAVPATPDTPGTPYVLDAPAPDGGQHIRPSTSESSLGGGLSGERSVGPRESMGSIRSRNSAVFDHGDMVGEPGNLTIKVVSADGLLAVDKNGLSDPFVKVRTGGKTVLKTKVKKENLEPVWDEEVTIPNLSGHNVLINIQVKDHNTLGSDKDLGEVDLAVWDYIRGASESGPGQYHADFWAPLGAMGGRIRLILDFEPAPGGSANGSKRSLFGRK